MMLFPTGNDDWPTPEDVITDKGETFISTYHEAPFMTPEEAQSKLGTAANSLKSVYNLDAQEKALDSLLKVAYNGGEDIKLYERIGRLQSEVEEFKQLTQSVEFAGEYLAHAQELNEADSIASACEEAAGVLSRARHFVVGRKFTGPHDARPALVTLRAGVGGASLEPYLNTFASAYARFGHRHQIKPQEVERHDDTELALRFAGSYAYAWIRGEDGLHRIIYEAPDGSRQTGYIAVTVEAIVHPVKTKVLESDISVEFIGASTPGGQHANKTLTGVRLRHKPTGITAISRMRSQAQNIKSAREVLESRVELHNENERKEETERKPLGRGHHFRSYGLSGARFISDHRSGVRMKDPNEFFQSYIEPFVFGFYKVDFF